MTTAFVGAADLSERLEGAGCSSAGETLLDIKSCTGRSSSSSSTARRCTWGPDAAAPSVSSSSGLLGRRPHAVWQVIGFTRKQGTCSKGYCDAGGRRRQATAARGIIVASAGNLRPAAPPITLDGVAGGGTAVPVAGRKSGLGASPR
ncbi:hypothetical protein ZWY2020_027835 [Hordeum vulgare]|nr:hypothetical protein ZWY2020_027835 [Hordeum vulgare]